MEIRYRNQPPYSKMCGQTVLAMILDKEIIDICNYLNRHNRGTNNTHMYKVFKDNNIEYNYKRCKNLDEVPNNSVIKLGYFNSPVTHWTLKINDEYYDPAYGIIKKYNTDFFECISYINYEK